MSKLQGWKYYFNFHAESYKSSHLEDTKVIIVFSLEHTIGQSTSTIHTFVVHIFFFHHKGRSNCHWSSCQEGCTSTVFTCWHVLVQYVDESGSAITGKLYPNIKVSRRHNMSVITLV